MTLDPTDGRTFWVFNEYSALNGPTGITGVNGSRTTTVIGYQLDETSVLLPELLLENNTQNKERIITPFEIVESNPQSSLPDFFVFK